MKSPEKIDLYRGNIGKVRMQFIFYEMCPGASRFWDVPWLHRYSQNEAETFIDLNGSRSSKMSRKEEK